MKEGKYGVSTPYNVRGSCWKETFNSPYAIASNRGTATAVSCLGGLGTFNGTTSKIYYNKNHVRNGTYSVRIRLHSINNVTEYYLLDYSGDSGIGYIKVLAGTVIATTGTIYVDGALGSTITTASKEVVVTGMTILSVSLYIGCDNTAADNFFPGEIDVVEEFDYTLNAYSVLMLSLNAFYGKGEGIPLTPTGLTVIWVIIMAGRWSIPAISPYRYNIAPFSTVPSADWFIAKTRIEQIST